MQLIYIHGLNSDHTSEKGQWLEEWCKTYRPEIKVVRPNLNLPPNEVIKTLLALIKNDPITGLVASSLGGFYANVCVAQTGCKAVLLNPSMQPYISMQRYFDANAKPDDIGHTTPAGWQIKQSELTDLQNMAIATPPHPQNELVLLKTGDSVVNFTVANSYFSQPNAQASIMIEEGGDHYYSDLKTKIPMIVQFLFG